MRTTTQYICSHFPNETDHLCIGLIPWEKAPCYLTLTSVFTNSACIGFKWSMWICFRISLRGLTTLQLKAGRCHPHLFFSPLTQTQVTELGSCCWFVFNFGVPFSFFFFFSPDFWLVWKGQYYRKEKAAMDCTLKLAFPSRLCFSVTLLMWRMRWK